MQPFESSLCLTLVTIFLSLNALFAPAMAQSPDNSMPRASAHEIPATTAMAASPGVEPSPVGTHTINSYKECMDPQRARTTIACGAKACPGGTTYLRTVRKAIPECNSSRCVDIKALGWKHGHKNKFCIRKGFHGVRPASRHDYSKGGCCFMN